MSTVTTTKPNNKTNGSNTSFESKPEISIWKPRKDGKGSATIFGYSDQKHCFFVTTMPQADGDENSRKFNKDAAITAKLGVADIGALLTVLNRNAQGVGKPPEKEDGFWGGLYHKSPAGSTTIGLSHSEKYGLQFRLSADRNGNKAAYNTPLTDAEAEVLKVFFSHYLIDMLYNRSDNA